MTIENFDSGFIELESYKNEDIAAALRELDANTTFHNSPIR